MRRYRLVFDHDRAGRLVEAHEFEHLRMARERFDPELLDDFRREAAETVQLEGDDVVISHAYVERRLRPLNLFLGEADDEAGSCGCSGLRPGYQGACLVEHFSWGHFHQEFWGHSQRPRRILPLRVR